MQEPSRQKLRVVVIDDCSADRAMLRHHLSAVDLFDAELEDAASGPEGLQICKRNPPDCIFLDVNLLKASGLEVLAELQADPVLRSVPVIMLTGVSGEGTAVAAMQAGASDYLTKDRVSWTTLSRSIGNALEKAEMRRRVESGIRSLKQTNAELAQRNDEIQSFYHAASHQLKTPLSVASENLSLVLDNLFGELDPEARLYLETALRKIRRVAGCVDDISEAMALGTGDALLLEEPTHLPSLAQCAIQASIHKRGARVGIELVADDDLPLIAIDANKIARVIDSLLANAVRHSPERGTVTIRVQALDDGSQRLAVEDTGSGIDPQHAARIFERLYQGDLDVTESSGDAGLGLGLYLCREILHIHGGEVAAESSPNDKTIVHFTLPSDRVSQADTRSGAA